MNVPPNRSFISLPTIVAVLFVAVSLTSCQRELHFDPVPEPDHNILLRFKAVVQYDSAKMEFNTPYTNAFNETYSVKTFKFYVHGIQLINTDSGKTYEISRDKYYLINFADSISTIIPLSVLPYKYNRIAFILGVDSARNVSGAQTDALDPTHGMFWTWNSGYIMAKLEGTSPNSTAAGNRFEYHIGGFRQVDNVVKRITLLFPFGENVDMKPGKTSDITITADVNDWFKNPHDIKISAIPTMMTPGPMSMDIAENYSKMFTVVTILND